MQILYFLHFLCVILSASFFGLFVLHWGIRFTYFEDGIYFCFFYLLLSLFVMVRWLIWIINLLFFPDCIYVSVWVKKAQFFNWLFCEIFCISAFHLARPFWIANDSLLCSIFCLLDFAFWCAVFICGEHEYLKWNLRVLARRRRRRTECKRHPTLIKMMSFGCNTKAYMFSRSSEWCWELRL